MPRLVSSDDGGYDGDRARIIAAHERGTDAMEAIEWALRRMTDFSACTDIGPTSLGRAYVFKILMPVGVLVTFAFEPDGGEGVIHLMAAHLSADG